LAQKLKNWEAQYVGALVITEMQRVTDGLMGSKTNADHANELWKSARVPMDRFKKLILTNEFGNPEQPNEFIKSLMEDPDIEKRVCPWPPARTDFWSSSQAVIEDELPFRGSVRAAG
jgi:hypothetical protein